MEVKRKVAGPGEIGTVLFTTDGDYEVIITLHPDYWESSLTTYGIFNKVTRILESFVNNFDNAKYVATELSNRTKVASPRVMTGAEYLEQLAPAEGAKGS